MNKFSSTKLIKLVLFIFGLMLLYILISRFSIREITKIVLASRVRFLILGLLVYIILIFTRALKWFLLIRITGLKIKYNDFLPFYFVNCLMGNMTPLKLGEAITPLLFKKYLKITANRGFSILLLDRFFELTIFTIILILAVFYLMNVGIQNSLVMSILKWVFVILFFLIIILITVIFSKKTTLKILLTLKSFSEKSSINKILEFIEKELQIFYNNLKFFQNKKIYRFMIPLTLASWFFEFLAFYLVLSSVLFASFLNIAVAQIISMAVTLVSFIPSGIGVGEIGTVYLLNLFNYPAVISTAGVLIARIILTGTLLAAGTIGSSLLKERVK